MVFVEEDSQSNTAVVVLCEKELQDFPKLIAFCERNNVSKGKGVFKGRLQSEEVRVTGLEEILKELKIAIAKNKFTPSLQTFECYSEVENVFVYCSHKLSKGSSLLHSFIKTIEDPSRFSNHQVTCCSQTLERGGVEDLLTHLWYHVRQKSIPGKNCAKPVTKYHIEEILSIGKELRDKFNSSTLGSLEAVVEVLGEPPSGELCPQGSMGTCEDSDLEENLKVMMGRNPAFLSARDRFPKTSNAKLSSVGVVYGAGLPIENDNCIYITKEFTLSKLKTILDLYPVKFSGMHNPFAYIGLLHTISAWHTEDASLCSISFNHFGAMKLWVVIPPKFKSRFISSLRRSNLPLGHTSCQNILGHKAAMVDTDFLKQRGIPFSVVIQKPGEFVFVEPDAAHLVFNCGTNIAEAVNFASESWITHGIYADKCDCLEDQVHIDMLPFLAAFKPELVESYIKGQHLPPGFSSDQKSQEVIELDATKQSNSSMIGNSSTPKSKMKKCERIILKCPFCPHTYVGGRGRLHRLLQHGEVSHPSLVNYRQHILSLYPANPAKKPKKFECNICGMVFAGGPSNVRRHKISKHSH